MKKYIMIIIVSFCITKITAQASKPISNAWRHTIIESIPNTLSLGYKVQLELGLLKTKKSSMTFSANFQNDTPGDVITGLGIVIRN